ncbi:MAG TPA: hypothetical protein VM733_09525 [Thermoanaerobaculia bacterium]|nr:hypothetical protein [Thermoanaerobaculia bacterium]
MVTLRFALLTLALIPLGTWARPFVRDLAAAGRIATYFAFGLLTVVAEMFALSMCNVHWSAWMLVPLPLALTTLNVGRASARPSLNIGRAEARPTFVIGIAVIALTILVSAAIAAMATSGDYVYFWGVKGQRWGAVHILDYAFTTAPSHYMHPDYPPLLPLYYAWTLLGGDGALDWWGGILATPLFLMTGAAAMWALGRRARVAHIDGIAALFVSLFALFYVRNQVAGNAEPPLHMFEAIALAALIARKDVVASVALSAVALTKVEGGVFVLIVCGVTWLARERMLREKLKLSILPVATLATWLIFAATHALTDTYLPKDDLSIRFLGPTLIVFAQELAVRLWYLPWIAFLVIVICGRVRSAIPYLLACAVFLAFLVAVYMRAEPHNMIWSAGRTLMTPLLLLIAAAMAAHAPSPAEPAEHPRSRH